MGMWDDVVIGSGDKQCSSIKIDGFETISQNRVSYWLYDVYIGLGMTVFKNTPEGQYITNMITNLGADEAAVKEYAREILIRNVKTSTLIDAIDNACMKAYKSGSNDRVKLIKGALEYHY